MNFTAMRDKLIEHFGEITKDINFLYEVGVDKDELWNTYLDSFPTGTNEIFRERREHDCSCCRQFIKTIGNAVTIKNGVITTIWDFRTDDTTYQPVLDAMSSFIKAHMVSDIYVSKYEKIGTLQNYEKLENGQVREWSHFYLELPNRFVDRSSRSEGDIKGSYRDTKNVFKRSLDEISAESILTVLELIASNTLYKGEEWKNSLAEFLKYKQKYSEITDEEEKNNYAWENSVKAGIAVGRIRNHSIGTLLVNISEGMDLDSAVRKYEQIVAPNNYKRPKAIFTKKMLEDAKKTIEELGYMSSLERRFATLDDISINNILFSNKDAQKRIAGADDVFASMEKDIAINPKKFFKVEEVSANDFVKNVLPTAKEIEVFLENRHSVNMVSLIAPQNVESPTMFKWNNGFSWAYTGNITDSNIRENVKAAGGAVDGVLRFSIQWNDMGDWDKNDLDAHCKEPSGEEIMYSHKRSQTNGQLDIDITNPNKNTPAVENITWASKRTMKKGKYQFFVHQFANRGGKNGFRAEIEFDGNIYCFDYQKELRQGEKVPVAEVTFDGENFSIKELLSSNMSVREVWGVKTNQFVPVSVIMYSPNYWDEQDGIGHRHYFFMLKDCVNSEMPNGFYNEFLKAELGEHKRVFEALGSKMHVEDVEDQLSGIGFSATKRNELIVKVKGVSERVIKVKF